MVTDVGFGHSKSHIRAPENAKSALVLIQMILKMLPRARHFEQIMRRDPEMHINRMVLNRDQSIIHFFSKPPAVIRASSTFST